MIKLTNTGLGALALSVFLSLAAQPVSAEPDVEAGKRLAYTCMGCHGIDSARNAYPSYRVPKLGGQRAGYIESALKAYRAGTRPHPTMQAQGYSLSDQDIEDIAAWYQTSEPVAVTVTGDEPGYPEAGVTCLACHGVGGEVVQPTPPVLSGQHLDYLIHALNQYKSGVRTGNVMTAFASTLSDADIKALATFYSGRDGVYTADKSQ